MKFRDVKLSKIRKKQEKINFYEDVLFYNKIVEENLKKFIAEWVVTLQEHSQIEVTKFKEFFTNVEQIEFPIKIKEIYGHHCVEIKFIDKQHRKYSMIKKNIYDYREISTYTIEEKETLPEYNINKEYEYTIGIDKAVFLNGIKICKKDEFGILKSSLTIEYCNWSNTTEVTFFQEEFNGKLRIRYMTLDKEFEESLSRYLIENDEKNWHYYDVFSIFNFMLDNMKEESNVYVVIVADVGDENVSELKVINNVVEKYTTTKIVNEREMCTIKRIFSENLYEFLKKHN